MCWGRRPCKTAAPPGAKPLTRCPTYFRAIVREHTKRATTLIGLATQLHSIAAGNLTPSYQLVKGRLRPVYIYAVDVSEFAVDKLRDRGTLGVTSIVTNIQDFLVILRKKLVT